MATIVLIRPPVIFNRGHFSVPLTMPLATAYLVASLIDRGHKARVIDSLGEAIDSIGPVHCSSAFARGLPAEKIVTRIGPAPDAIGISAMFSSAWLNDERLIRLIHLSYPHVPIILGGEHATATADFILRTCPDVSYVALGEGERTLVEFADFLDGRRELKAVDGLAYVRNKKVHMNNPRRRNDPDKLPRPAWHMFDLEPYFKTGDGYGVDRDRSMPILASRGCPYYCTFCSSPQMWSTRYRTRSFVKVVDEIESYLHIYGAKDIHFMDINAPMTKTWVLNFCREIRRRSLRFTWQLPTGIHSETTLTRAVLMEMYAAGCRNLTVAPDSGSSRTLERIKKKVYLPSTIDTVIAAKRTGLFVKCNLIIGFPDETWTDVLKSLGFSLRMALVGVDDVGLFIFSPYPGSEIFKQLSEAGYVRMDRNFLESSTTFMDLETAKTFCLNIGSRELTYTRVLGMAAFYSLSFTLRPWRLTRLARNFLLKRSDTVFEQRLQGGVRRLLLLANQVSRRNHVLG